LRASGDGKWIAFLQKTLRNGEPESQLFAVSPVTRKVKQLSRLPGGLVGNPRFSPDSRYVACVATDGAIWSWSTEEKSWGRPRRITEPNSNLASRLVISPDAAKIAFNRSIDGVMQIFVIELTR
jgi:Tol biopolymer transport system component